MVVIPNRENYLNYILDRLSWLETLRFRKLAGGVGFFSDNRLFGAIVGGRFRLRSPDLCQDTQKNATYLFANWAQSYCEVPQDIIEEHEALKAWVMDAIHLAEISTANDSDTSVGSPA